MESWVYTASLTTSQQNELPIIIDQFTEVISGGYLGEPYALRGGTFFVYAALRKDRSLLDKAAGDLRKALSLGSHDEQNLAVWRDGLEQIGNYRRKL